MTLAERIVGCARRYQGVVEQPPGTNSNSGPEIDQWLAFVHQPPGQSYCAAYVCFVIHDARVALGMDSLQFRKSASALHLLELNANLKTDDPQPGDLVIFDHGHGLGHVATIARVLPSIGRPAPWCGAGEGRRFRAAARSFSPRNFCAWFAPGDTLSASETVSNGASRCVTRLSFQ